MKNDPLKIIASWSDSRLEVELDQAMAAMDDGELEADYRESAMAAAALMAIELAKRKNAKRGQP